jgi:endogenous inhibitor of DNA gyrase (YacG/DUF329 family)
MECFAMKSKCKFCDEEMINLAIKNRHGGYCSKVCRMIDLEDSLIKQKQKIRGML